MTRKHYIYIRVDDSEFRAFQLIARREGANESETFRLLLREGCNRRGLPIGLVDFYEKNPALAEAKNGQPEQS